MGTLGPQSHAELTVMRSGPCLSIISTARAAETLVFGIKREPGIESGVQNHAGRVLFGVIDQYTVRLQAFRFGEIFDRDSRALVFVFQMRCVNQNQLIEIKRQLDMIVECRNLISGDSVQSDLTNADDVWPVQVLRYALQNLGRQLPVLSLFRI